MNNLTLATTALLMTAATATAQWNLSSVTTPPARIGHAMGYNPIGATTLMFGGDTLSGPFGSMVDETWSYDGSTWTQLTPANSPPATRGIHLVYDINRGVYVTYGGAPGGFFGGPGLDQTFEFDGTNWTEIFPVNSPGGRINYSMCYDSVRGVTIIHGGELSTQLIGDSDQTWEWDGNNWTQTALAAAPGPLERAAMCYHEGLATTVMFGGIDVLTGGVDTTWLYDGTSWTAAGVPGTRPIARTGCSMVYDSSRQVCIMTGGQDFTVGTPYNDTWEFDLATLTWTEVATSYTDGRRDFGMAFDAVRRQAVMFGGANNTTFTALPGTWEYGAKSMTFGTGCLGSNGTPALDATDAPRIGTTYTLNASNLNTTTNVGIFALSLTPIAPVALDGIGMTGCTGYAAPDSLNTITGAAGAASLNVAMPTGPSFLGVTIDSQVLSLDPNINPLWLAASNGHQGVLGF